MKNRIYFTIVVVLIFSLSCNVSTGTGNPDRSSTEQANYQGKNPWILTATECNAPKFDDNVLDGFKYFQGMWQEAKVVPNPEPRSMFELNQITAEHEINGPSRSLFPLGGTSYDFGPPCTWVTLSSSKPNQYYFLYRSKDGMLQKYTLKSDAVLEAMLGNWKHIPPPEKDGDSGFEVNIKDDCPVGHYCLSASGNNVNIGPLPELDTNSKNACFGTEDNYICLAFVRTDWLQTTINEGEDISSLLGPYSHKLTRK